MPMVIPALVAGGAAAAGGTAAVGGVAGLIGITSVTTGAIVNAAVGTALVVGASYAVAKLTAPPVPKPAGATFEYKQPLPARFFVYGLMKYSGPVLLLEMQDRNLHKIIAFGSRELASIEHFYVNSEEVELDEDGALIGHWDWGTDSNFSEVHTHLGLADQVADPTAIAEFSDGWTADHRLRGIAYAYALLDSGSDIDFNKVFGSGQPEFSIVGGVKVYDPRKDSTNGGSGSHRVNDPDTWEFSDNQRLCTLDWITWSDGYGKDWSRIDWATWVPQINMADEDIALKYGGTEKRYRVATKVSLDEPRSRVLNRLLAAGDQQLFTTATGLIGSRGGVWQPPSVSIAATQILEGQFTHGIPAMDKINEFQLSAMLPSHDYAEVELESWSNTSDPEFIAGIVRRQPLELLQVPSNGQAQRLAKIRMAKVNSRWSGSIRTNFAGLNALGEAVANLSFDELDQPADSFNGPFLINGKISFLPDKTGMTVSVSSIDPACYDWDASEEKDPPPRPQDPWNTVAPVASGTLTVGSVLSCTTGAWTKSSTGYTYQWQRDGINISGATSSTYTLVSGDGGAMMRCVVTATNDFDPEDIGIGRAVSNALGPVTVPATLPVNTVLPAISGTVTVGQTLTASSGTWTGTPTPTYAYQWKLGGVAIGGATASTYVLQPTDAAGLITVTVTATNSAGSVPATSTSVGPVVGGAALLLVGETDGFAVDFTYPAEAARVAVKAASAITYYAPDAFYANTTTSPKMVFDATGAMVWAPHNMMLRSEDFTNASWTKVGTPIVTAHTLQDDDAAAQEYATQTIALIVGATYTLSAWFLKDAVTSRFPAIVVSGGTTAITHLNTSTGAKADETTGLSMVSAVTDTGTHWKLSISFVPTQASNSFSIQPSRSTVIGTANNAAVGTVTVDRTQLHRGSVAVPYLTTTSAARYGLAIDYDPSTLAARGVLGEPAATNLLLNNSALSTQNVTVTAVAHTLSFWGTGTVTLSGVSTAGPLVGTGAANRVSLTFTPTAGSLTLTVSGTVSNAQLEIGTVPTSLIPTLGATVTRAADQYNVTPASINYSATAGSWWSEWNVRAVVSNGRIIGNTSGAVPMAMAADSVRLIETTTLSKSVVWAVNTTHKSACAFSAGDRAVTMNGATCATDAGATTNLLAPGASIFFGNGGSTPINGWQRKHRYVPRRKTNAEMVTETT